MTLDSADAVADDSQTRVLIQRFLSRTNSFVHVVALIRAVAVARLCVIEAPLMLLVIRRRTTRSIEVEVQIGTSLISVGNVRVEVVVANVAWDIVNIIPVRWMILLHGHCSMILKIHDLRNVRLVLRCRDANGERLDILVMVHDILRRLLSDVYNILCRCRLEVVRLRLTVLVIVVLSVVVITAAKWCTI